VVNAYEVALWKHDVATGQSNAEIEEGMTLCEGTLLRGLLVHSAGNYAELLTKLMGVNDVQFVAMMNRDAKILGLRRTHYTDYTGIDPGNVSTASEQAILANDLMSNEPIVRSIVALAQVTLPVAGVVASYTPDIGQYGVIGVKSGFTLPAGGCDVMAINVTLNHTVITTYAVVLGQQGSNPLAVAGQAALTLSRKLHSSMRVLATLTGRKIAWVGWAGDLIATNPTTTTTTSTTSTTSTSSTTSTTVPAPAG